MSTQLKEENHAEQQAKAQLESIVEMVAALDEGKAREMAAKDYASKLSNEQCIALLSHVAYSEDTDLLREMVAEGVANGEIEPKDFSFEFDEDEARQTISEDPLSIQLRSGWYTPGETPEAEEFEILLCTGGPAVRIIGELGPHNEPSDARLQYQDWFTPWVDYTDTTSEQDEALLTYCQQFYFGD